MRLFVRNVPARAYADLQITSMRFRTTALGSPDASPRHPCSLGLRSRPPARVRVPRFRSAVVSAQLPDRRLHVRNGMLDGLAYQDGKLKLAGDGAGVIRLHRSVLGRDVLGQAVDGTGSYARAPGPRQLYDDLVPVHRAGLLLELDDLTRAPGSSPRSSRAEQRALRRSGTSSGVGRTTIPASTARRSAGRETRRVHRHRHVLHE